MCRHTAAISTDGGALYRCVLCPATREGRDSAWVTRATAIPRRDQIRRGMVKGAVHNLISLLDRDERCMDDVTMQQLRLAAAAIAYVQRSAESDRAVHRDASAPRSVNVGDDGLKAEGS